MQRQQAETDPAMSLPRRWTRERIAWLGFLVGAGWDAKRIAADPDIRSTPGNVQRQARRCGLSLVQASAAIRLELPSDTRRTIERLAAGAGMTPERLLRRWIVKAAANAAGSGLAA